MNRNNQKNLLNIRHDVRPNATGSVMSEYLVTTGVVILALIVPIPGLGHSALDVLMQALNGFQDHSTVFLSMP